jgi:exodeoxyribonuclease-3
VRLATWNINSVRLRKDLLARVSDFLFPDVLCLQETKTPDEFFPRDALESLGYVHIAMAGMKSYNGVAIASKLPIERVSTRSWCEREDCRHIAATIQGIEVHCLYIPAGGDIPDPVENPKFAHKLAFLDEAAVWFKNLAKRKVPMAVLGDFNVAPLPTDVWSHKQLLSVVSHTPIEVEKLDSFQRSASWVDAVRKFVPPEEQLYTWWSYRSPNWETNDRGRRLDHIWVTPDLEDRLVDAVVLREARNWIGPSDHVPVVVELK